jgi:hypothetical protein
MYKRFANRIPSENTKQRQELRRKDIRIAQVDCCRM